MNPSESVPVNSSVNPAANIASAANSSMSTATNISVNSTENPL